MNILNTAQLTQNFGNLLEVLILVLEVLYIFFAFLVTRQASLMNKSFTTKASPVFMALANFHLIAAIILTALSALIVL